jgi:DNA-binding helix-hairpin-helix protein with protein kinase domain
MRLQARPSLGEKLGEGGEGAVFVLSSNTTEVAKIYRKPLHDEAAEKLEAMVSTGPGALGVHAAWPRALLRGEDGRIEGFIMARAPEPFDIHEIYSPRDRSRHLPGSDWGFLVRVAANTAVAFAAAHAAGIVIGDVNHGSVRVGKDGKVRLIDCDSMQFTVGDRVYRCQVGMDTYTPPELQARRLADIDRTPDHDAFGLAVLIFQLLFLGRHPYSGVPVKPGAPTEIAGAIAQHGYAYLDPPELLKPPPAAPPLSLAGEVIAALFLRAFKPEGAGARGQRPTARDWAEALTQLAGGLTTCSQARTHVYRSGLAACPWCAFERAGIAVFAGPVLGALKADKFEPDLFLRISQRFLAEAARTKRLGTWKAPAASLPVGQARRLRLLAKLRWYLGVPVMAFSLLAGFTLTDWAFLASLLTVFAVRGANAALFQQRSRRIEKLMAELKSLTSELQGAIYADAISMAGHIELARAGASKLLKQARALSASQKATPREVQLRAYLDSFRISPGCVQGIGAGRIAQLVSFGIETAADVDARAIEQVPGFADQLTERLLKWRRDLEKRFRFNPKSLAALNARGQAGTGRNTEQGRYLAAVSSLDVQVRRLASLNDQLETRRTALEPQISRVSEELERLKEELRALT